MGSVIVRAFIKPTNVTHYFAWPCIATSCNYRKLKESSPGRAPDELKEAERHLLAAESENRLLQATIDRMKAQLAYYEERHVRQSKSSEVCLIIVEWANNLIFRIRHSVLYRNV